MWRALFFHGLFIIVDKLGELCNYNWGTIVYQFLVQSLCLCIKYN